MVRSAWVWWALTAGVVLFVLKLRIEAEAAAMWNVIGEAAEKTKAWQQEVRDQVALESRVAKIRAKVRPGGGRSSAVSWDDDLSDIPF